MSRVKRGVTAHRRHKKVLALTKGHHGQPQFSTATVLPSISIAP